MAKKDTTIKDTTILVRVTDRQKEVIRKSATDAGLSMAAYLRMLGLSRKSVVAEVEAHRERG